MEKHWLADIWNKMLLGNIGGTMTDRGAAGAQFGTRLGAKLRPEQLRVLLALLVLMMSVKTLFDLTLAPADIYSIGL